MIIKKEQHIPDIYLCDAIEISQMLGITRFEFLKLERARKFIDVDAYRVHEGSRTATLLYDSRNLDTFKEALAEKYENIKLNEMRHVCVTIEGNIFVVRRVGLCPKKGRRNGAVRKWGATKEENYMPVLVWVGTETEFINQLKYNSFWFNEYE